MSPLHSITFKGFLQTPYLQYHALTRATQVRFITL